MKGITRFKGGYLARHYWGKKEPLQEYFYDREYKGDPKKSEAAAEGWLKRISEEYPAPPEKGRKPIMGIVKDGYGFRSAGFYVAWTDPSDGRQRKRSSRLQNMALLSKQRESLNISFPKEQRSMKMDELFSVYQFFLDKSYEKVAELVPVKQALALAISLTRSLGANLGTTRRIIITDIGDCTCFEWIYGRGVTFPTPEDIQNG